MTFIYITGEKIKSGSAGSTRILSFCRILISLDKHVTIYSLDDHILKEKENYTSEELRLKTLRGKNNSSLGKIYNRIIHPFKLRSCLKEFKNIEGIVFYNIPLTSVIFLKRFSRKQKIKLFHDSVEWYSPEQFYYGKLSLPYISKNILNKYLIDKSINVFAISDYLNNYYKTKGINSIRIPIIVDMCGMPPTNTECAHILKLIYAGSPGKKDNIKDIIHGIALLSSQEIENLELHLLGISEEDLIKKCGVLETAIRQCGPSLIVYGRVTREEVLKVLSRSDFSLLLRPSHLRFAKAGFPTKVVESLGHGVPVISNLSSDLEEFLVNGQNSLIVPGNSAVEFNSVIKSALRLSIEEKKQMRVYSKKTAVTYFDERLYKKKIQAFIERN